VQVKGWVAFQASRPTNTDRQSRSVIAVLPPNSIRELKSGGFHKTIGSNQQFNRWLALITRLELSLVMVLGVVAS